MRTKMKIKSTLILLSEEKLFENKSSPQIKVEYLQQT